MGAVLVSGGPWAGDDRGHNDECHARWAASLNRPTAEPGYQDGWYDSQCGGCRFWVALSGELGQDYGACTNSRSPFDGRVRFEHDGCDCFAGREDGSFG
ncbi:DUF3027 domain-containing protein [Streptomyces bobili]|uniref:DUF3027 domain-containing protein n=1 Tax=Streptomyces bobili TaxID=67280 RepID=UPI0036FE1185